VNSFVGGILILAVLIDIWVRQGGLFDRLRRGRRRSASGRTANA
jgi:ribose transport system permease protein